MTSAGQLPVRSRWILHFTHLDNLAAVVRHGLLSDVRARASLVAEVGDKGIKESRRRKVVPVRHGGTVADYVPFYFAPRSPMMYRIACDHRDSTDGRYGDGDRPLLYLVATVGSIVNHGLTWVATDGNAATATTEFTSDLGRLDEMVDWPLMVEERWNNIPEDPDRQRRRMAEFLVRDQVPFTALHQIGAFDETHASAAAAVLSGTHLADRVLVRRNWYYGYERR